jgi:hypothetical protein
MTVELLHHPTEADWVEVKRRALVTIGRKPVTPPTPEWRAAILRARHSPIRWLTFSFLIECPYWVSVHLCRHHAGVQPYVRSQRNDRQDDYDRNKAPQDAPVTLILDVNAEALITMANKRLCRQAAEETRAVVADMCRLAAEACPEIRAELVPMCARNGGVCYEMNPCGGWAEYV